MALVKFQRRSPVFPALTPFTGIEDLPTRIRQMFEDTFDLAPVTQAIGFMPATEIVETTDELVLTAELPGIPKDNVEITIDGDLLTLRGEKMEERKEGEDDKKYHLLERTYGSFQRSFTLPRIVDPSKIKAEFIEGVLKVHMPKTPEAKARGRKVEIEAKK